MSSSTRSLLWLLGRSARDVRGDSPTLGIENQLIKGILWHRLHRHPAPLRPTGHDAAGGRWTWFRAAEAGILVGFTVLVVRNALVYPAIAGLDAIEHKTYAWELVVNGELGTSGSYYTPPGWYAIAGELLRLGERLDLSEIERPAQLLSALLVVVSAILLLGVVERAFPGRPWLRLWSLAVFCACPAVVKPAAMFHPQALVLLLTTLGLLWLVGLLTRDRWPVWSAIGLGLVLGAAQLVRSVGLWIYAVAAVAFVVAVAVASPGLRRRMAALGATTLAIGLLVALPWYVYLQVEYGDPIFGGRPEITQGAPAAPSSAAPVRTLASSTEAPPPVRAPLSFFTGTGLTESITHPYRGEEDVAFVPILIADTWGDFFGFWSWGIPDAALDPPDSGRLTVQMVAGILLTFVTATGLLALLILVVRSPRQRLPQLPVVALPLVGLASLVLYAWRYPSTDGDTVKALFLLPAAPSFAVGFGFATDVVRSRSARGANLVLGAVLAGLLVICAQFGVA